MTNLTLEISPNGHIKFRRGNKEYNKCMIKVLSSIIDDQEILDELTEFFKGSEEVEVLVGDSIFCG